MSMEKATNNRAVVKYSIKRICAKLLLCLSKVELFPSVIRYKLLKMGGGKNRGQMFYWSRCNI